MAIVVQKYGGSSLADVEKLSGVASQIVDRANAGDSVVVVVSAMGKTTESLIKQAKEVSPNPPRREMDMLVTAGERISMALISMAIHDLGAEAISFTGSQSGIITEDSHQGARILEVRPYRLEEALADGKIVIVAGYQGVSLKREITTLGRGGSDTTAVALAAALGADSCEIYSDVDGVYDVDPNVCPQAKHIAELDYETMKGMANAGAKVLNAQAVQFAERAGIKILARKTGNPGGKQTEISKNARPRSGINAVVGVSRISRLRGTLQGASTEAIYQIGGEPFIWSFASEEEIWIHRTNIPQQRIEPIEAVAVELGMEHFDEDVVTLVGSDLINKSLVEAKELLVSEGVSICAMSAVGSRISFSVEKGMGDKVVALFHKAFLEEA